MSYGKKLRVIFSIGDNNDLTTNDFVALFECADDIIWNIMEQEMLNFLDYIKLPSDNRIETISQVHRLARKTFSPAEVEYIKKGSWNIGVVILGSILLFVLKKYLHPTVLEAWNESCLREKIIEFLREKVFMGAKRSVEQSAVIKRRYRSLTIAKVGDLSNPTSEEYEIEIQLTKSMIVDYKKSEKELLEEFVKKLKG